MTGIEDALLQWGAPGAIILVLGGVVVYLYKKNEALQEKMLDRTDKQAEHMSELADKVTTTVGQVHDLFSKNRGE